MSATVRSAAGLVVSVAAAWNVPRAAAGTRFPDVSLTCPARSEMVYVPLSARSHVPPGAVIRYVAVRGVPSLFTSTPTNVAYWLNPFGPVTRTSVPPRSDTSTASLSEYVTVNV